MDKTYVLEIRERHQYIFWMTISRHVWFPQYTYIPVQPVRYWMRIKAGRVLRYGDVFIYDWFVLFIQCWLICCDAGRVI